MTRWPIRTPRSTASSRSTGRSCRKSRARLGEHGRRRPPRDARHVHARVPRPGPEDRGRREHPDRLKVKISTTPRPATRRPACCTTARSPRSRPSTARTARSPWSAGMTARTGCPPAARARRTRTSRSRTSPSRSRRRRGSPRTSTRPTARSITSSSTTSPTSTSCTSSPTGRVPTSASTARNCCSKGSSSRPRGPGRARRAARVRTSSCGGVACSTSGPA